MQQRPLIPHSPANICWCLLPSLALLALCDVLVGSKATGNYSCLHCCAQKLRHGSLFYQAFCDSFFFLDVLGT